MSLHDPRTQGQAHSAQPALALRIPALRIQTLRILALASMLAAPSGCATIGHPFSATRVKDVQIGSTSKTDLLGLFGLPYRRGVEDGDSTWTYLHYKVQLFGEHLRTRDLYLRFDDAGRVKSFSYNSNMEE